MAIVHNVAKRKLREGDIALGFGLHHLRNVAEVAHLALHANVHAGMNFSSHPGAIEPDQRKLFRGDVGRRVGEDDCRVARVARVVPALLRRRVRAAARPALAGAVPLLLTVARPGLLRVGVAARVPPGARLRLPLGRSPGVRLPALLVIALVTPLR